MHSVDGHNYWSPPARQIPSPVTTPEHGPLTRGTRPSVPDASDDRDDAAVEFDVSWPATAADPADPAVHRDPPATALPDHLVDHPLFVDPTRDRRRQILDGGLFADTPRPDRAVRSAGATIRRTGATTSPGRRTGTYAERDGAAGTARATGSAEPAGTSDAANA